MTATKAPIRQGPACPVDGCNSPRERGQSGGWRRLCRGHRARQERIGDLMVDKPLGFQKVSFGQGSDDGHGYIVDFKPGHPLAMKNAKVRRHRWVLYDKIGPDPHPCHWCAQTVHWAPVDGQERLTADHLDGDITNNRLENLVPACTGCNTGRGNAGNSPDWMPPQLL